MISLTIDGKRIEVLDGATVLQACLSNQIYVPNLCYLEGSPEASASCRLCFVEIDGLADPVPSCTLKAEPGMVVRTTSARVRTLQISAFRLLLSMHPILCSTCPANKRCELQRIAKHLKVGLKLIGLEPIERPQEVRHQHPLLDYHPYRCVLCERCISACRGARGEPLMSLSKRGLETEVSFFGAEDVPQDACRPCQDCVKICPVMALTLRRPSGELPPSEAGSPDGILSDDGRYDKK